MRPHGLIPMSQLRVGGIYYVESRNLSYAVYVGKGQFRGIREKFGDRYLFDELHWDIDEHHGTVTYAMDLGLTLSHAKWSDEDACFRELERVHEFRDVDSDEQWALQEILEAERQYEESLEIPDTIVIGED